VNIFFRDHNSHIPGCTQNIISRGIHEIPEIHGQILKKEQHVAALLLYALPAGPQLQEAPASPDHPTLTLM
jgi:hypothetical protein